MSQDVQHELEDLKQEVQELKDIIKPMAEAYSAAVRIGKWGAALAGFVSIMIGIALGLKELLSRK